MTVSRRRQLALASLAVALAACGDSPAIADAVPHPGVPTRVGNFPGLAALDAVAADPVEVAAGADVARPFLLVFDVAGLAIGPRRVFARLVDAPGDPTDVTVPARTRRDTTESPARAGEADVSGRDRRRLSSGDL